MDLKEKQHKASRSPRTTLRHRRLLPKIVESNGKSIGRALLDVGYSKSHASNPKSVLTTKGFRALLYEKGLTEELVAESLREDIINKPRRRVQELQLAADILKMRGNNTPHDTDWQPVRITVKQMNVMVDNTHGAPVVHTPPTPTPPTHTDTT